jgi:uncharacterized protein YceK
MRKLIIVTAAVLSLISGCASVPTESPESAESAKEFNPPSEGMAGIYVFRKDTVWGAALKKDIWIDGQCVGETAKGVFFYREVEGDKEHKISTESEFSPNDLVIHTKAGELYFIKQYIKLGLFVGGANLMQFETEKGKQAISKLQLAKGGQCSSNK